MKLLLEHAKQKTLHSFQARGFQTFVAKPVNKAQIDSRDKVLTRSLSDCIISDQLLKIKDVFCSEGITGLPLPSVPWELCHGARTFFQNVGILLPSE